MFILLFLRQFLPASTKEFEGSRYQAKREGEKLAKLFSQGLQKKGDEKVNVREAMRDTSLHSREKGSIALAML